MDSQTPIKVSLEFNVYGVETEAQGLEVLAWLLADFKAELSGHYHAEMATKFPMTRILRDIEKERDDD